MKMHIHTPQRGEFRAVVHTGHSIDADGNEIHGEILRESKWGKNLITSVGLDGLMQNAAVYINIVTGSGNAAPTLADTTLDTYVGKASVQTFISRTANLVADGEGYFTLTTIYRATFNPGSLGSGTVNLAEAGTAMSSSPNASSLLFSRGLLVDDFGTPITVSLNAATEYLDIYWKHIRYIPSEITGTQDLTIMGSTVSTSYTVRPVFMDLTAQDNGVSKFPVWWCNYNSPGASSPWQIPGLNPNFTNAGYSTAHLVSGAFDGTLSTNQTNAPSGNWLALAGSTWTKDTYTTGSGSRLCKLNITPTLGNLTAGIKTITLNFGFQGWQMQFDPVIMKNATPARVLRLDFTVSVANKT